MRRIEMLFVFVVLLASISFAMGSAPPTQEVERIEKIASQTQEVVVEKQEKYEMKVLAEIPWGNKPGELGVGGGGELAFGPSRLVVDGQENIYIFDTANNRIQKFKKDGRFLKGIPIDSLSVKEIQGKDYPEIKRNDRDIGIDEEGELYVLNVKDKEIRKIDEKGRIIKKFSVPSNISSFAVSKKDNFVVHKVENGLIRNMGLKGGKYEEEIEMPSGMRIILEPQTEDKKQYVKILDKDEKLVKRVEIKEKYRIWKVRYKGTDKEGNIYLYVQRFIDKYIKRLIAPNTYKEYQAEAPFVYKYNSYGKLLAMVSMDTFPYAWEEQWKVAHDADYEGSSVDNEGNIYLMVMYGDIYNEAHPTPRSFKIYKWERLNQ